MDKDGWTKTKRGRRVYERVPKPFSKADLDRIFNRINEKPETNLDLFDFLASLFERHVVRRFDSIPLVDEAWEAMRDYTRREHEIGRPMSLPEQLNWLLQRLQYRYLEQGDDYKYLSLKEEAAYIGQELVYNYGEQIIPELMEYQKMDPEIYSKAEIEKVRKEEMEKKEEIENGKITG